MTQKEGEELKNLKREQEDLVKEFDRLVEKNTHTNEELNFLREMRVELTKENEEMVGDLKGHQTEIESVYKQNKELKHKIKRLEQMLYGRNMSNKQFKK